MAALLNILLTLVFVATLPAQLLLLTTVHPALMFLYAGCLTTVFICVLKQRFKVQLENLFKPSFKESPNALEEYQELLEKQKSS